MKPKSKKDQFVIKMNNGEEVQKVKDYYCADNTDSWVHFNFSILHDDIGKYSMLYDYLPDKYSNLPVISFDQWQSLPDFPKREYEPKDVAFKIVPVSELEEIKPNKIIGYKLIKPEYKEAAEIIAFNHIPNLTNRSFIYQNGACFTEDCKVKDNLEEAGVMHWFELVYDTSITLKSGVTLSEDDIAELKQILKKL